MKAEGIFRKDERNWLLAIDKINKRSAEGIALSKSENYYTHVVCYNPDAPDQGYAVYQYWRYYEDEGLPKIEESEEWQIKRLKLAIERHTQALQNEKDYIAACQQELINLTVGGNSRTSNTTEDTE